MFDRSEELVDYKCSMPKMHINEYVDKANKKTSSVNIKIHNRQHTENNTAA